MHLSPIAHKYALIDEDHVRKITQDLCHLLHMPLHLAKEKGFPLRGFSLMVVDHPKNDLQSHAAIPGKDLPDVITALLCQIPVPKCTDIDHCQLQRISLFLTGLVKLIDWAVAGIKIDDAIPPSRRVAACIGTLLKKCRYEVVRPCRITAKHLLQKTH